MKKISKKQIENYKKVSDYLNMRNFDTCARYVQESCTKVDAKIKRLHLDFNATLALANEKLKEEQKIARAQALQQKKQDAKREKMRDAGYAFKKKINCGIARTIEYVKPFCFNETDFLSGSYRENTGAGYYNISLRLGEKFTVRTEDSTDWDTYAKRCSFPCHNYDTFVTLPKKGYFQLVGGLWTWTKTDERKGSVAAWIEQKGIQCYPVYGFLVNGYHVSDENIKTLKQAREYVLAIRLKQRAKDQKLASKKYTIADSIKAGNCHAGSLAFANAHNIDPNGTYTGKFLLSIATANELPFVKRFVK